MFGDKFRFETLSVKEAFLREKRIIQNRGDLIFLTNGEKIRYITFFTLNAGNGYFRGEHYNKKKTEKFYVISGRLRLYLSDVETNESTILMLKTNSPTHVCAKICGDYSLPDH